MANPGIILAAWPGTEHALTMGQHVLKLYEEFFPDATVYIGTNPGPYLDQWLEMVKGSSLNIIQDIVPEHLLLNSDASAYQLALKLYRDNNVTHDLLWFNHFRGASHSVPEMDFRFYDPINELMLDRVSIEQAFKDDPTLGLYALTGWPIAHDKLDVNGADDHSSKYLQLPYSTLRITVLHTFYAIRNDALRYVVDNCVSSFFEESLSHRYFFESDFYHLIFRQGYIAKIKTPFPGHGFTQDTFNALIRDWKAFNGL